MEIKVAPAITDADLGHLADTIAEVQEAGADVLHVDVMDGHFVPALVGGQRFVAAVKRYASVPVDVHLMITNPDEAVPWFLDAGADIVFFHPETTRDTLALIGRIRSEGRRAGVALTPNMEPDAIREAAPELDCVVAMTVQPGFSGQSFLESGCRKIPALRQMCGDGIDIYVDGGVNERTAPIAIGYGANVLAVASAVFGGDTSPGQAVRRLKQLGLQALRQREPGSI